MSPPLSYHHNFYKTFYHQTMDMFIKMHRSGQNFPDKVISAFWVLAILVMMVMVIVMHGECW